MSIKVLIADDHEVVRSGLLSVFEDSEIEVVAQASDGEEAVAKTIAQRPDVLLMDIRMPEADGIQALARLRSDAPETKVVVLSTYDNPTYVARAVALGAKDYALKGASEGDLIATIRRVAKGGDAEPKGLLSTVKATMSVRKNTRDDIPLTNRESQVLRHIALGLSNREIGVSLTISIETVKEHVQNILRKIDATDRTQAAIWAVRMGLVD
ncbi:response regulator transcription factor [Mariniblastus sp.]|jgi:DNA-binding NarL/FixJ family response regulator|nr:response regulator transcription factor [Mariniblastus sp.]MDB4756007.1 response regulator transcription factor [Mariniblastus sp.]